MGRKGKKARIETTVVLKFDADDLAFLDDDALEDLQGLIPELLMHRLELSFRIGAKALNAGVAIHYPTLADLKIARLRALGRYEEGL